jgi:hypothetical protein
MKCIQCQTENNLKDRTANFGNCSSCKHKFAFEPTTMLTVKVTDPMFKKTIDELSANNTLFFTEKQLTYFLDKRLRRFSTANGQFGCLYIFMNVWFTGFFGGLGSIVFVPLAIATGVKSPMAFSFVAANFIWQGITIWRLRRNSISTSMDSKSRRSSAQYLRILGFAVLLLGIPASLIIAPSPILFAAAVLMGMGAISWGNDRLSTSTNISQELLFQSSDIKGWLKRWQEVNGTVFRLLSPPANKNGTAAINPDVTAYSFDRLVVCQSAEIAQMLIANNFHFENNCAILSIEGYPQDIFDVTMQMLRRNLDLKVYIFHDCSPQGMGILKELKTSDRWFKNSNVAIIDIGITPNQVMKSNHLFIHTSTTSAEVAKRVSPSDWTGLTLDEVAWLEAGNYVELESFTPQQLIQVLNRGIAGTRNLLDESNSYTSIGGSDGYLYTTQSFG